VQEDFLETYEIELVAGRDFSKKKDCDTCKFIVNESAANMFGLDSLIGESANIWYHKDTIIGIVKDFHFESLYESIGPLVFTRYKTVYQYISVRTKSRISPETIEYIQKVLQDYFEDAAFNYYIVEDQIRSKHSIDEQNTRLMLLGTLLAIFTSALGLFGQISFTVVKRTKEMGIRKTHGANAKNIVALMIADYGKFVLPAVAIAIPFAIIMVRNWMQNFAYKTDISVWIYFSSVSLALTVSLFAILIRVIRFALINPAESLRYE
jgi:putative ABC transport system permease protein